MHELSRIRNPNIHGFTKRNIQFSTLNNARNRIIFEGNAVQRENTDFQDLYPNTLINTPHGRKLGDPTDVNLRRKRSHIRSVLLLRKLKKDGQAPKKVYL